MVAQSKLNDVTRQIRDQWMTVELNKVESLALKDLDEWELREKIFWKQKSQVDWLHEDDTNTTFFHNSIKAQRSGNYITSRISS